MGISSLQEKWRIGLKPFWYILNVLSSHAHLRINLQVEWLTVIYWSILGENLLFKNFTTKAAAPEMCVEISIVKHKHKASVLVTVKLVRLEQIRSNQRCGKITESKV